MLRGTEPERKLRMAEPEQLHTVLEVASLLRVSKMTIYRLIRDGSLPALRVGRCFRVRGSAVDAFVTSAESSAEQPYVPKGRR